MDNALLYILLGVFCGSLTGFIGGGAGILIIPLLVFFFGFTQHQAQGTALAAFVLPVTLSGAILYWKNGNANLAIAVWIAAGLCIGNFLGAHFALKFSSEALTKLFGVVLLFIALKMIFIK
ncbi:MAG: sulfite exporter TauE/SafE family protein [bacterium]|nr:sulfite exporter TauE/SafE family protein [bacterium]